jgi:hypothetical protein
MTKPPAPKIKIAVELVGGRRTKDRHEKPPLKPPYPAPDATEAEREKFRRDTMRWLDKYRGVELNAKGLEQERYLIELLSLSPDEIQRRYTAETERLRNLLGGDFAIVWPENDQ